MKDKYIVLGSNNFWYSIDTNLSQVKETVEAIKNDAQDFADEESGHIPSKPETLYIYKIEKCQKEIEL